MILVPQRARKQARNRNGIVYHRGHDSRPYPRPRLNSQLHGATKWGRQGSEQSRYLPVKDTYKKWIDCLAMVQAEGPLRPSYVPTALHAIDADSEDDEAEVEDCSRHSSALCHWGQSYYIPFCLFGGIIFGNEHRKLYGIKSLGT